MSLRLELDGRLRGDRRTARAVSMGQGQPRYEIAEYPVWIKMRSGNKTHMVKDACVYFDGPDWGPTSEPKPLIIVGYWCHSICWGFGSSDSRARDVRFVMPPERAELICLKCLWRYSRTGLLAALETELARGRLDAWTLPKALPGGRESGIDTGQGSVIG